MTKSYMLSFTFFALLSFSIHIAGIGYFFEHNNSDLEGGDFEITAAIGNSFADFVQGTKFTPVEPQRNITENFNFEKVPKPSHETLSHVVSNEKVLSYNPSSVTSKVMSETAVTEIVNLDIKKSISSPLDLPSQNLDKLSSGLMNKWDIFSDVVVPYNSQVKENTLRSVNKKNFKESLKQTLEAKVTNVLRSQTIKEIVPSESIANIKSSKRSEFLHGSGPSVALEELKSEKPVLLNNGKPVLEALVGNALETENKGSLEGEEQASAVLPKDLMVKNRVRSGTDKKSNYAGIVLEILKKQRKFKFQSSGSVRVKLSIDRNGNLSEVTVLRSSGFPRDDRNARRLIKKAGPFPKPPNSNSITFEVELKLK